jgi:hypothetical protein
MPINTHTTSGGGGGGGSGPETLLDLDFTGLDAQDLTSGGDGAKTLSDGQAINVAGTAQVGTLAVDSSGLRIAVSGAAGSYKSGSISIDLSAFSDFADFEQYRLWVLVKVTTLTGHTNGPASAWLTHEDAASSASNSLLVALRKYKGDATYSDNLAINGLTYHESTWSGGPSGAWGDLSTSTVPSQARLEIHGVDADVWLRGDTGSTALTDMGALPRRARIRLEGTRFETSDDFLFGGDGFVHLYATTYDAIDVSFERLVIERYGAA